MSTIINVQGRKSRYRSADDIEKIVRINYAQGLRSFFITDDNFARNKHWEAILDRLIHPRHIEKLHIGFIIQVDTLCHKLPNFVRLQPLQVACRRLPLTLLPTISRMIVRVSLAASSGGKAVSATLLTNLVMS